MNFFAWYFGGCLHLMLDLVIWAMAISNVRVERGLLINGFYVFVVVNLETRALLDTLGPEPLVLI